MNELMTLNTTELSNKKLVKHLIKVMKNEGIGDGYSLEEVEKLW